MSEPLTTAQLIVMLQVFLLGVQLTSMVAYVRLSGVSTRGSGFGIVAICMPVVIIPLGWLT